MPSAPPQNVLTEALDSQTIKVQWDPPARDKQNGQILGYRVLYTEADSVRGFDEATRLNIGERQRTSAEIGNLRKFTDYKIWVVAYTSVGDGPPSDVVIKRTDEDGKGLYLHCWPHLFYDNGGSFVKAT